MDGQPNDAADQNKPVAELRSRARVLAVHRDEGRREDAIRLFEKILDREPNDDDRNILAQLYEIRGDWPKAKASLLRLMNDKPGSVAYRLQYLQALIRNHQAEEAAPYLEQLDRLEPDAPRAFQARAEILVAQGKKAEGVGLVKDFALKHQEHLLPAAKLIEVLGEPPVAEELIRRFVQINQAKDPKAILELAEFLGRHDRTAEAIDICESAWKTCPIEAVANSSIVILTSQYGEEQSRRIEALLASSLAKSPNSTILQLSLASLRSLQGRYDESVALTRRVLAQNPKNVVAMNNLAWLLAMKFPQRDEALQLIEAAIHTAGPRAALLDTRAVVQLAAGRPELAVRDLETAVGEAADPTIYLHLAQAYLMMSRPEVARNALRDSRRLGLVPTNLDPLERPGYERLIVALDRK
jgi:tetratricopeptide (TPR) repeat protein